MELRPCDNNDFLLLNVINMLDVMEYGINVTAAYELIVDGEKKYLIIDDLSFFIVNIENNVFASVDIFEIDEDGNIIFLLFHDKNVVLDRECNQVYRFDNTYLDTVMHGTDLEEEDLLCALEYYEDDDYEILNSIVLNDGNKFNTKYSSYNANLCYTECNLKTRVRLDIYGFYNARFDGTDKINVGYFKQPYLIKTTPLINGLGPVDDREYFLVQWYRNYPYYNLALAKTVGLFNSLFSSYKDGFEFYYNKEICDDEGNVYLGNLITSGMFDLDDLNKKLALRGLSMDIPSDLIDLFNGESEDYKYCLEILSELNKVNKLCLKRKCNNDRN